MRQDLLCRTVIALTLVSVGVVALSLGGPAARGASGPSLTGTGTATIDGVFDEFEWSGSGRVDVVIDLGDGTTAPARFHAMNDASQLYLALRVSVPEGVPPHVFQTLSMYFDNDADGTPEEGDDGWFLFGDSDLLDSYRTFGPTWCPIGCFAQDVHAGAYDDGVAKIVWGPSSVVYEVSKPLRGDAGHDINVTAGSRVGWTARISVWTPSIDWFTETFFPTAFEDIASFGSIVISDAANSTPRPTPSSPPSFSPSPTPSRTPPLSPSPTPIPSGEVVATILVPEAGRPIGPDVPLHVRVAASSTAGFNADVAWSISLVKDGLGFGQIGEGSRYTHVDGDRVIFGLQTRGLTSGLPSAPGPATLRACIRDRDGRLGCGEIPVRIIRQGDPVPR